MYRAPILKKAIDTLRLIIRSPEPLGVSQIARELSLVKSTVLEIAKALEEQGLILQDGSNKKYVAGKELLELSREALKSVELPTIAHPYMERLVEAVDETVCLGVREDDRVRIVDVVEPRKELKITSPVGTRFPISTAALMKIFLSGLERGKILDFLKENPLPAYTAHSITNPKAMLQEVERAREAGYGLDLEEYHEGVRVVAALVGTARPPEAAIWIIGLAGSMDDRKLPYMIEQVRKTAELITTRLSLYRQGRRMRN
jgi:IclR family transcriptional regulator, KDG regulon repressor